MTDLVHVVLPDPLPTERVELLLNLLRGVTADYDSPAERRLLAHEAYDDICKALIRAGRSDVVVRSLTSGPT